MCRCFWATRTRRCRACCARPWPKRPRRSGRSRPASGPWTGKLEHLAREHLVATQLQTIPGIGGLTATALVATVGDVARFASGRHFASYLGLTPREHSSALRRRLGAISKRGDPYLRMLLIHGARSVLSHAKLKTAPPLDRLRTWALQLERRRGPNRAAVALANKLARMVWAVRRHDTAYVGTSVVCNAALTPIQGGRLELTRGLPRVIRRDGAPALTGARG